MTDDQELVKRLRYQSKILGDCEISDVSTQAADTIERLVRDRDLLPNDQYYIGHDRGVAVINDGKGNFSERPMTAGELAARLPAKKIADNIHDIAIRAAFAYIRVHEFISAAIDAERDAAYLTGALAMREACAKHHNEMVKFCLSEREQEERKDMRRYWADIKSAHHDSAIAVRAIDPASVKS